MIISCTCHHPDQDRLHGRGKRVHNACKAPAGGVAYRCTICGNVKSAEEGKRKP